MEGAFSLNGVALTGLFPEIRLPRSLSLNEQKVVLAILLAEASFFRVNEFQRRRLLFHLYQSYPGLFESEGEPTGLSDFIAELLTVPTSRADQVYEGFTRLARECGVWQFIRPCEADLLRDVLSCSRDGAILLDDWQKILDSHDIRRLSDVAYYSRRLADPDVCIVIAESLQPQDIGPEEASELQTEDCQAWFRKLKDPVLSEQERTNVRNDIFQANQKLVPFVLSKLKGSDKRSAVRDYDDDLQTGYTALLLAIEKFDIDRGLRFSTYAVQCIRGSILRYRNRYRYLQHVPENQNLFLQRALRMKSEKEIELGREIHLSEWAEYLSMPASRLQPLLQVHQDPLYLGDTRSPDAGDDEPWLDQLSDSFDVEQEVERKELALSIRGVLNDLGGREGDFLRLRMGIYDSPGVWEDACSRLGRVVAPGEPVPTAEIAKAYSVTSSHVRQTSTKAVGKLRALAATSRLAEYL